MGRKKKDRSHLRVVAFEISEPLRQRIRRDAFNKSVSFSAMIREILERFYEER